MTAMPAPLESTGDTGISAATPLAVVRSPMLSADGRLYAYELLFHDGDCADAIDEAASMRRVLSAIIDGAITRLARGGLVFLRLTRELLLDSTDVLANHPLIGVIVERSASAHEPLMLRLRQLFARGCAIMLDMDRPDPAMFGPHPLMAVVTHLRFDARLTEVAQLARQFHDWQGRGLSLIAGHIDDQALYAQYRALSVDAFQGRYLLLPQQLEVPVLTANRLSLLRLIGALQDGDPDPLALSELVRNDAVLSYKLLGCVNSAYFALPRPLKTIQQAAIFFGATRMRTWIGTMALASLDDQPPELLRAALIRAHMCELLASDLPEEMRAMAFMTGLLSLLDTLMRAPMEFVLDRLPLAAEIRSALLDGSGPFAHLLAQVHAWERAEFSLESTPPAQLRQMADIYLEAVDWADHVYAFAEAG